LWVNAKNANKVDQKKCMSYFVVHYRLFPTKCTINFFLNFENAKYAKNETKTLKKPFKIKQRAIKK
jgi:hypothetical protein